MSLPFLPGNSFNPRLGRDKFHKSQHFDYSNEVPMLVGGHKPGIGGDKLLGQTSQPQTSNIPLGQGNASPAWVAFDKQVLHFDAFFQEAVHEMRQQYRIRKCKIYFYLEDDSIQVIEPLVENSGIPQGTLIRRHRIPLPPPNDDQFYTVEHFNVDQEITLYGRTFKITGCDQFTYNFLKKLGVRIKAPAETPKDPYTGFRKGMDEAQQPLRPYEKVDTLKQFLDHDRHVLRFLCFWDDRDNMFGDLREFYLHYFLADDTIEIKEIIQPNAGRDKTPMFLRRGRMSKISPESLRQPGEITGRTVLNVFGPTGHGGRYILDSLKTGAVHSEFYMENDLTIGSTINANGRWLTLADCDDFTKEYYKQKYGVNDYSPVNYRNDPAGANKRHWPPYTGFGSEEDSLCSCMGLLPKPPRRDFIKFMEKDRHGLDSNVIRFVARLDTTKPIDVDRRFIISYFLSDDTVAVFEPPERNSGIIGGKFLERGRIKKPNQARFGTELSDYFTARDLYVGSRLNFHSFFFVLIDADEYAFRYMEKHAEEFPMSNIGFISQKISTIASQHKEKIKEFLNRNDPSNSGHLEFDLFRNLLVQLGGSQLSEHEIIVLARYYSDTQDVKLSVETLVSIVQEQLKKNSFENFTKLLEGFLQHDTDKSGYLDGALVRSTCNAFHLPLPDDLLRALISRLEANEDGLVNYNALVTYLNWRDHPMTTAQYVAPPANFDESWTGKDNGDRVKRVNYIALLQSIFPDM
ncbi:EF-hand domain-containing family member C2 [Strongylocentrotus purpuratus]|uniref:EF-hand domain-containing family member C2 n=1 Tax=Strongylocentrotus purpuratus TaxID=7668 RepID=A0A7M7RHU7_STRPU|nr:EF-hand domain-containing family member C2 [Strongylocentrotus purpuratus]8SNB_7A Chain 7A, EF-hand domain-containing family member C2 [Strongylocentrotus purpuratus]8SNB_7B Chain 7B, EF-hand domain-containing family member C2 [Strongylocentrotus purpuratus]8SNB_7C Chain 7C, EF-hand domain-containing family member C2 [Strongylocentrotus purpuratus]8SNB_7D Chain 7D, EF-hand domain-containing family member C2 [Strongylocentrotus purpuratus]|eukprot:XP_798540.1 PREDICTED: EF-hand domain-containing family member C2 [Strongylocentrotus purpuratus]